jgi:UDP-N-acetylmuramate--alanine ligase
MRGLALLYDHLGYEVSGCDRSAGDVADLTDRGIRFLGDHDPSHVEAADLVIRSSAVPEDAPEMRAAGARGVPVLRRARALGAALNGAPLAGIAGTHGKTTITAMTGYACEEAGLDPTVMVGGHVGVWGGYARLGDGPAIVEADEYDRSFLELDPTVALVSSLEAEHLDIYGDFDGVRAAFRDFASRAGGGPGLLYCADDEGARALGESMVGARSYGFAEASDYRLLPTDSHERWHLVWAEGEIDMALRVPGRHNAQNAAGAFAVARTLGGDPAGIVAGVARFPGVGRRLEILGTWGEVTLVDDYAHHPTEVAASIEALRAAYPSATLNAVFQPHLFTRTRDFADDFAAALGGADHAFVLPIYPAREKPIEGVTSDLITATGRAEPIDREGALELARQAAGLGRRIVIAFMGAGDVTGIAREAAAHAESGRGRE